MMDHVGGKLAEAKKYYDDEKKKVRAEADRKHRVHLAARCKPSCFSETPARGAPVCKTLCGISLARDRVLVRLDRLYDEKLRTCLGMLEDLSMRMEECTLSSLTMMAYDALPDTFPGKVDLERLRDASLVAVVRTFRDLNMTPYLRELTPMSNHRMFLFDADGVPIRCRYELWWLMMHWFRKDSESVRVAISEKLSALFAECVMMQSRRRIEGPVRSVCGETQAAALCTLYRCQHMWIEAFWAWAVDEDYDRIEGKRKQLVLDEAAWKQARENALARMDAVKEVHDPYRGMGKCIAGRSRNQMLRLFTKLDLEQWAGNHLSVVLRMWSDRRHLADLRADWFRQLRFVPCQGRKAMLQSRRKFDAFLDRAARPVFEEWDAHVHRTEAAARERMHRLFTHEYYYTLDLEEAEYLSQMEPVQVVQDVLHVTVPRQVTGVMGYAALNMKPAGYWVSDAEQAERRYKLLLMDEFLDEEKRLMSGAGMHELWLPMQSMLARRGPFFVQNMLRAVEDCYILQGLCADTNHREHVRRCADEWKAALWYMGHGVWMKRV